MKIFTQKELDIIYRLIDSKLNKLDEAITEWVDFGDEPPEFLLVSYAEYNDLLVKIKQMIR